MKLYTTARYTTARYTNCIGVLKFLWWPFLATLETNQHERGFDNLVCGYFILTYPLCFRVDGLSDLDLSDDELRLRLTILDSGGDVRNLP